MTNGYGPRFFNDDDFDRPEYESEAAFARSEGFELDDDGHWVPMEHDDDIAVDEIDFIEDDDRGFEEGWISEEEFARGEGFYLDDDGNWIPHEGWD